MAVRYACSLALAVPLPYAQASLFGFIDVSYTLWGVSARITSLHLTVVMCAIVLPFSFGMPVVPGQSFDKLGRVVDEPRVAVRSQGQPSRPVS